MSYSFSVNGNSTAEAVTKAKEQFDAVVTSQPVHATDRDLVVAGIEGAAALFAEPSDAQSLFLSVYGSIYKSDAGVQQVGLNISAQLSTRAA